MPVTAKFQADFSDFDKGVAQADAKLGEFGSSAGKAGGDLKQLASVAETTVAPFNTLHGSLQQFDGALAAAGIHIGPEIRALGELSDAAGKSALDIGLLGVAGLSVGAAIGGWKIGRLIADFTGSDKAIGDATAKLMGWTVAAGGAGSASDTLARASAIVGREVLSMAEAIQINTNAVKAWQGAFAAAHGAEDSAKEVAHWRGELQTLKSGGYLESLTKDLESHNFSQAELARRYGISTEAVGLLSRQMAAHQKVVDDVAASHQKFIDLQDHLFGRDLTAKAQEYSRAIGDVGNASKLVPALAAEVNKAMSAAYEILAKAGKGAEATAVHFKELAIATTDWAAINAKLAAMPDPFAAQLKNRSAAFRDTQMQIMNLDQGITDSQLYWSHAGEIADESMKKAADAVESVIPPTNDASSAVRNEFTAAFQSASSAADAMAAHVASVLGALTQTEAYRKAGFFVNEGFGTAGTINRNALNSIGAVVPGFAGGVTNFSGGTALVGERGPELVNLPRGSSVTPNGGGVTVNASISINGQGAQAGREAADALLKLLKDRGVRI